MFILFASNTTILLNILILRTLIPHRVNRTIRSIRNSRHRKYSPWRAAGGRVGYFGICVQRGGGSFICNANATALAGILPAEDDPLNLVWVASTFKDAVVFPYLIIVAVIFAFVCFLILGTFPGWHEETSPDGSEQEVRPFPSRPVSQVALSLIFVASVFILVSVLWQHTASVAASTVAQDLGNGSVKSGVGTSAMILGWFGFGLLVVVTIGLLAMILSISLLTRLTDD
ncbi:hypothetical protein CISG_04459 [Coccidioides immitis RMSCC 3703]|uniref:Membrane fusion mating protein FIG1 n=1 Tax=Coccidioides immitis RMSCC 3703 TaxID=454286 RepID=A0A0J8TL32_COCIT|nr:hypothetical protein CISG_04459 [Coccidioides immitis RMSCC 3703]